MPVAAQLGHRQPVSEGADLAEAAHQHVGGGHRERDQHGGEGRGRRERDRRAVGLELGAERVAG